MAASASAADLPSRKAAPAEYVKICSAYGNGFFFIPGTDTCVRIGGAARFDFHYNPGRSIINAATGAVSQVAANQDTSGMEVRGILSVDGRTETPYGTVQTVFRWRLTMTDGIRATSSPANFQTSYAPKEQGAAPGNTLERAYIRFGGLSVGVIDDEFSPMPSLFLNGNFTPGFTNGVKAIGYTQTFGGGFSANLQIQARGDFAYDSTTSTAVAPSAVATGGRNTYVTQLDTGYNLVGVLRNDASWGMAQVGVAIGNNSTSTAPNTTNNLLLGPQTYASWAISPVVNIKLPMIAPGDNIWLQFAYGHGMIGEVTGNSASNLTSDSSNKRALGGVQRVDTNLVPTNVTAAGVPVSYGLEDAYMLFAGYTHFWTPSLRSSFGAMYMRFLPPTANANGVGAGLNTQNGSATLWQVQGNLIWSPTRQFDIGVELAYGEMKSRIQNPTAAFVAAGSPGLNNSILMSKMRLQRTF